MGLAKSSATRKAQRFFKERRIPVHFVDFRKRGPAPGELRRWVSRLGVEAVVDPDSRSYREQGLAYLADSEEGWIERLVADPALLRLPLARCGQEVAAGEDPDAWARMAELARAAQ